MPRTASFLAAVVSAFLVVSCSTQSPPTAPSPSLGTSSENLSPGADRIAPNLPVVRSLHEPCDPNLIAPNLSPATASPNSLWPPNHKWVNVSVGYTASSPCIPPQPFSCSLSVSSNEDVNGLGDGNTAPDWQVVNATLVRLRAERSGRGNGRIYTITGSCRHASGGPTATATTTVMVPHDRGKK